MNEDLSFDEMMDASIAALIANSEVNEISGHATYTLPSEILPEGITPESLEKHVTFIGQLENGVNQATFQLAQDAYKANNEQTQFDGTLDLGYMSINSQHFLQQNVGEQTLYGQSTCTTDYVFGEELNAWRDRMTEQNIEAAASLFQS